jgi:hypothetical protein
MVVPPAPVKHQQKALKHKGFVSSLNLAKSLENDGWNEYSRGLFSSSERLEILSFIFRRVHEENPQGSQLGTGCCGAVGWGGRRLSVPEIP